MGTHTVTPPTVPAPSHSSDIKPILDTLSTTNMQNFLAKLTSFNNRHYKTSTGKAASQYIFDTVTAVRLPFTIPYPSLTTSHSTPSSQRTAPTSQ